MIDFFYGLTASVTQLLICMDVSVSVRSGLWSVSNINDAEVH